MQEFRLDFPAPRRPFSPQHVVTQARLWDGGRIVAFVYRVKKTKRSKWETKASINNGAGSYPISELRAHTLAILDAIEAIEWPEVPVAEAPADAR